MTTEIIYEVVSEPRRCRRYRGLAFLTMGVVAAASACGNDDSGASSDATASSSTESGDPGSAVGESVAPGGGDLEEVDIVLGWLAEPSRGGLFAAAQQGYFADAGVEANLVSGTEISAVQLVGAGRAEFGIGDGDELLAAREQGIPVVALAAAFQTNPRILLYHSENPVEDFASLNGRTIYLDLGDDWWEWVKENYKLDDVDERAYTGQLSNFIDDENSLVQGYVGSEDVILGEQGFDVGTLRVGESGFNPYTNVLFTTVDYAEGHPELVEAVVDAHNLGWEFYRDGFAEVNTYMREFNEELTVESMNETAVAQEDFIFGGDAVDQGVGYMSAERWAELDAQLRELGVVTEDTELSTIIWSG